MAFNAKNLHYESKEPSFLRNLRSQYSGNNSSRHERPVARPRKPKDDDEDDEPTYVDEDNQNTITKAEYEAMLNRDDQSTTAEAKDGGGSITSKPDSVLPSNGEAGKQPVEVEALATPTKKELVATIGALNKRKAAKMIGTGGENPVHKEKSKSKAFTGVKTTQKKKMKLSFEDDT